MHVDIAVSVFDAGLATGGILRAPSTSSASGCRAMNRRSGESCGAAGKLYTGGVACGAFSMTAKALQ